MQGVQIFHELFTAVPELVEPFKLLCSEYEGTLDDGVVMWKVGVMECIEFLLSEGSTYSSTLENIFSFFERMATEGSDSRNFLISTVMNFFYFESQETESAVRMMKKETKVAWDEVVAYWKKVELWKLSLLHSDKELENMGKDYMCV